MDTTPHSSAPPFDHESGHLETPSPHIIQLSKSVPVAHAESRHCKESSTDEPSTDELTIGEPSTGEPFIDEPSTCRQPSKSTTLSHDCKTNLPPASSPRLVQAASEPATMPHAENQMPAKPPSHPQHSGSITVTSGSGEPSAPSSHDPQLSCSPDQLSEFTLFPKLPMELRLRVWSLAMFPRVVSFRPGLGKAPAILSVCREARKESRKVYRFCFHYEGPTAFGPGLAQKKEAAGLGIFVNPPAWKKEAGGFGIFINYDVDIIYFTQSCLFPPSPPSYDPPQLHTSHGRWRLLNNSCGLTLASWYFPLWRMSAKRIAVDLHTSQPPSTWEQTPEEVRDRWVLYFNELASRCPLIEEITLIRRAHHRVPDSELEDAAFKEAVAAFAEAETAARMDSAVLIQDFKTEKECAQSVIAAKSSAPPSRAGTYVPRWWAKNLKLTFVNVEKEWKIPL